MPSTPSPVSRPLLIPALLLLTLFCFVVLHPHTFDNPLLRFSTTLPSRPVAPLVNVNRVPRPVPAPNYSSSSSSSSDPAGALFRASSAGDQLAQCTLLADLLYSDEQQGNFSATLLALPHDSVTERAVLQPSSSSSSEEEEDKTHAPGTVRCLVTVTGPSFPGPQTAGPKTSSGKKPLPSDIGVEEDTKGTDLVTGHGVPITEEDLKEHCFFGCDVRVYQVVRFVSSNSIPTSITTRNSNKKNVNFNMNGRRRGTQASRMNNRNNNNNGGKKRGRRNRNRNQNQAQKQTQTQTETEQTETLTFIVVQSRFKTPCPPQPVLPPLQHADARYCFNEQVAGETDKANTPSFTLIGKTASRLPSSSPPGSTLNGLIRQNGPVPVPVPQPVPLSLEDDKHMSMSGQQQKKKENDELCIRYNWLLWTSTGQYDYAVGYRIRVLRIFPSLASSDSSNGVLPLAPPRGGGGDNAGTVPPPPSLPRQPSPPSLPLHCSTNGINAVAYDARHCTFGCDYTTYNVTALFGSPSSTLVQFSYNSECSGSLSAIRQCDGPAKFGPTSNNNRYPVAASFTVTDPQIDRERAVRTALMRLRSQSSFSDATIGDKLVVETKRIDGRTYRVIFRFREQFGSEL